GSDAVLSASGGACTVSSVEPRTPLSAAEMFAAPAETAVARPFELIVATPVLDEPHPTCVVRFCELPSEYVPVAVNCCVAPVKFVGFAGVTAIDASAGAMVRLNG